MSLKSKYNTLSPRRERVAEGRVRAVLMDGAMGTVLMSRGFSVQTRFEEMNESCPDLIREIHRSYIKAGVAVIVANTFRAGDSEKFNRLGVQIAKEATAGKAKVFASIGPRGEKSDFLQQVRALEQEKPDGYLVETMMAWDEAEAAAQAVRKVSDRTLIVSFVPTLKEGLKESLQRLRQIGVDVIGTNCGRHPQESLAMIRRIASSDPGPWLARPPAGIYPEVLPPEEFADWIKKIANAGTAWLGGCCGTNPTHIKKVLQKLLL